MKRGPGPLAIAALFLLLLGVACLTVELIQRRRFNMMHERLQALTREMERELRMIFHDDGHVTVLDPLDPSGTLPNVAVAHTEQWNQTLSFWTVVFPFPIPMAGDEAFLAKFRIMTVDLIQKRRFLFTAPVVEVTLPRTFRSAALQTRLDALFLRHGIAYTLRSQQ